MEQSREQHREAAQAALALSSAEGDIAKTNRLLEALVEAVLAISAPTAAELQRASAQQQFFEELENRDRRR
jgi:hypothetical protein